MRRAGADTHAHPDATAGQRACARSCLYTSHRRRARIACHRGAHVHASVADASAAATNTNANGASQPGGLAG